VPLNEGRARNDQNPKVRHSLMNASSHFESVQVWHRYIHHDHVRIEFDGFFQSISSVYGRTQQPIQNEIPERTKISRSCLMCRATPASVHGVAASSTSISPKANVQKAIVKKPRQFRIEENLYSCTRVDRLPDVRLSSLSRNALSRAVSEYS
jgi:hypothetical protein